MKIVYDKSFNWFAVLKDIVAGAPITDEERDFLVVYAGQWTTCACGQLCKALPRDSRGMPEDKELQQLGGIFPSQLMRQEWPGALETLYKIEVRSTLLLEEMEKEAA